VELRPEPDFFTTILMYTWCFPSTSSSQKNIILLVLQPPYTLTLFSRFIPAQKTRPVNLHFFSTIDGILENITTIYLSGTVFHLISPRTSEQPSYITRHLQIYGQFMLSFFFLAILCYLALHYTSVTLCI
jgi:hypothetical protein